MGGPAWLGVARRGAARLGMARHGLARPGMARPGEARNMVTNDSTRGGDPMAKQQTSKSKAKALAPKRPQGKGAKKGR